MADQNFRVKRGLEVGVGATVLTTTATGNIGINSTSPTSRLDVVGDAKFSGIVTAITFSGNATTATFATNAGISTNLKGGLVGNIPYQSATDTTAFLANGSSGTILQSNGVGNVPSWVSAAPANAITGLTIRDEGTIIGTANSITQLNFVGAIVSAASTAGIATITFLDYVSNAGVSTSVIGGIASVTQLNVSGITTVGFITATNIWNAGITTSGRVIVSAANSTADGGGQIYLNGATGNRIDFNTNGVAAPSFTTRSAGTRIVLSPNISGSTVDIGFGIESATLWSSISNSTQQFKWYAGTTNIASLFGTGELVLGTTTKTGTSSQSLQVTGGAYVSTALGIGRTNPGGYSLDVNGVGRIGGSSSGKVSFGTGQATGDFGVSILPYSDRTEIQAEQQGVSYRPLILNPISGGVGIGTTIPGAKLDVFTSGSSNAIRTRTDSTGSFAYYILQNTGASGREYHFGLGGSGIAGAQGGGAYLYDATAGVNRWVTDSSGNFIIGATSATGTASQPLQVTGGAYVSGNLGIGTTNPTTKLDVSGVIRSGRVDTGNEGGQIELARSTDNATAWYIDVFGNTSTPSFRIVDATAAASRLSIDSAGTVSATKFSGDGSLLTGIAAGIAVQDEGSTVGTSVTTLNFSGASVSVSNAVNGISTITVTASGIVTYVDNAGISTNLKGGLAGNIPYQSAPDTTTFLANGSSGTILQSNGVGNAPSWVTAAPAGAITGLTIRDEGTIVGGANSVSQLNFVGNIVSVASTSGIATVTFLDYVSNSGVATYATNAGTSTSVIGGVASVTQLSVSGVSTFNNNVYIPSSSVGIGTTNPLQRLQIGTANTLGVNTTGTVFVVTSNADVGIGTTNPTTKLDVRGNVNISGVVTASSFVGTLTGTATTATNVIGGIASVTQLSVSGVSTFSNNIIQTSGSVGLGTTNPLQRLQIGTANTLGINTTGTVFVVTSNADVGIGTTNPTTKLDVRGNVNISGVVTATTLVKSGGTSSQFLKADGSVDSNTYLTTESDTLNSVTGRGNSTSNGISVGVLTATSGNFSGNIIQTSGSVGIGTTNPLQRLQIGTANTLGINATGTVFVVTSNADVGIGTTNPTTKLDVRGNVNITGVVTASSFSGNASSATYASTAGIATALQNARNFSITGNFVTATAISFDGTGNVALAATITPDSIGLGTYTTGDYVKNISGTANQITVTGGTGEGSTPTLSIPSQFTAPQDVTVTRDLQVNRNLNVTGNITIGGTSATIFSQTLNIYDPDIILGYRTDSSGNDISNDNTANHGGVAIASTEGTPLVQLFIAGIETNPATYKKIMWFKAGTFSGLGTDAWLSNYAVGIGSTQFPTGTRLAAGSVQFTENDLAVVRNINASGIITGTLANNLTLNTSGTGLSGSATYNNSGAATFTVASNATSNNTPSTIVARDASGNFSAGTITANLTGTASTASFATTAYNLTDAANITTGTINSARLTGTYNISISGNAATATYATSAGVATYATSAGVSTSVIGGIGSLTQLQVTGISTFTNGPVFIGAATSTGTASQPLQVTGGAYVSGSTGIGTTNPTSTLTVQGTTRISGITTIRDVTIDKSIASPNATVPVAIIGVTTTGISTETNIDVVLLAKGTGATLAQVPDGTAVGGNKRGQYATDLQKDRSSSSNVASGNHSVICGGQKNVASASMSSVLGGGYNNATGSYSVVLGGWFSDATGDGTVTSGWDNTASGSYSACFGYQNISSGTYSAVGGGQYNNATAAYSTIPGGRYGTTRSIIGNIVFPACDIPIASSNGVTQAALLLLARETTTNTATVLTSDSSAASTTNQVILPNNSAYFFKGSCIAGVTGAGNTKAWEFKGAIKRGANAASTSIVGSVIKDVIASDAGASTWDITITADTTNGGIKVEVTGAASTTIRWVCKIETTEMTY